jgi:hypothetical protein
VPSSALPAMRWHPRHSNIDNDIIEYPYQDIVLFSSLLFVAGIHSLVADIHSHSHPT